MHSWSLGLLLAALVLAGCGGAPPRGAENDESIATSPQPAIVHFGNETLDPVVQTDDPMNGTASLAPTWGVTLTGFEGAEPTLGVTSEGTVLVVAYEQTLRSTDGGLTWTSTLDFSNVGPIPNRVTADPYLWVDPWSGRAFTMHMVGIYCDYVAWSDDDGLTWTGRDGQCGTPALDHPKLGSGPAPASNPAAGVLFPSVLYQCFNTPQVFGFVMRCAMSYDGGETWPVTSSPLNTANGACSALGGVTAARADGAVVLAGGYRCGTKAHALAVSQDGGLTWTVRQAPALGAQSMDPDVAFGPDGSLWMAFRGDDQLIHLARSTDLAASWDGPWTVSPPRINSTAFEAVAVRPDGSVAVAFLGTDRSGPPGEVGQDARWDLFITTWSPEGGSPDVAGFTAVRITDDPVHVGGICYTNQPCTGGRNLLEFIDAQVSPDGTLYVAYTESCFGACDVEPSEQDPGVRQVAVAWLRGW